MKGAGDFALPILAGVGVGALTVGTGGTALAPLAVASGIGVAGTVYQGQMQYQTAQIEEQQMKIRGEEEKLAGKARANDIRRELLATIGAMDAQLASRGIAGGLGGTPSFLSAEAMRRGNADLSMNRLNTLSGIGAARFGAQSAAMAGRAALVGTGAKVAGSAYEGYAMGKLLRPRATP
jgi:hypothetical protein